jgi:hypothetical protein
MKENRDLAKPRILVISVFFILVIPSIAHAYTGPVVFASTPVTPPRGWLWILPAFLIASIVWDWFVLRKTLVARKFLQLEAGNLLLFMLMLFLVGAVFQIGASFLGGFLPIRGLLGPPFPVYYGMSSLGAGIIFAVVNFLVLALFLHMKDRLLGKVETSGALPRKAVIGGAVIAYLLFLIPYFSAGATIHGHAGIRARAQCFVELHDFAGEALIRYADAHDNRLPASSTFVKVIKDIKSYSSTDWNPRWPHKSCPAEEAQSKNPRPYVWNSSLAGIELVEKEELMKEPVIGCPAGHSPLYFEDLIMLKRRMEEEKNQRKFRAKKGTPP